MQFGIEQILKMLPHAYPFLLIDKVINCVHMKEIHALKNVTYNENFFIGHFPGTPIMPGVLILEAMAQASGLCLISDDDAVEKKLMYFASVENAKFRKPVVPGDSLHIKSSVLQQRRGVYKFECSAFVEDSVVTNATIVLMLKD